MTSSSSSQYPEDLEEEVFTNDENSSNYSEHIPCIITLRKRKNVTGSVEMEIKDYFFESGAGEPTSSMEWRGQFDSKQLRVLADALYRFALDLYDDKQKR